MSNNPGCVLSHTKKFLTLREEQKGIVSDILAQRIEAIEQKYKVQSNSYDVTTLFSTLVGTGHCFTCGDSFTFFNPEISCCVCKSAFCSKHVKPITNETIVEAMDLVKDKNFSCEKCALILEYQATNSEKRKIRELKINSRLIIIYNDVKEAKTQLKSYMMQFEYLTDSITEVQTNKSTDKEDSSWGASYNASKTAEKKIMTNLTDFQNKLKLISSYPAKEGTEKTILKNINFVFLDFLKDFLPSFKDVQKKLAKVELNHVSKVYLFIKQLEFETKFHSVFRGSWGNLLNKAIEEIGKEVTQITLVSTGETDWAIANESLDKRVKRREKNLKEDISKSLLLTKTSSNNKETFNFEVAIANMVEPLLMRKVSALVHQMSERFNKRRIQAPVTNRVLGWLISELEKEFDLVASSMK